MNTPGESSPRTMIHRVRLHDGDGGYIDREYDQKMWYLVSDKASYLELEVVGPPLQLAAESGALGGLASVSMQVWSNNEPYWQKWEFGPHVSEERRKGGFELKLRVPKGGVLRCYIVPSKLLSVVDVWSMVEAVEQELGRPVGWDPDRQIAIRSWIQLVSRGEVSMVSLLLEAVSEELGAARSLRRDPIEEIDATGALRSAPECGLVSAWAVRRGAELEHARVRIEQDISYYGRRRSEHMPVKRIDPTEQQWRTAEEQLERTRELAGTVRGHIVRDELDTPVTFGAATQRDYRLRKLLRAFAPLSSEVLSAEEGADWSRLPPVTINRLFEYWGAVWLVRQIRSLGFEGSADLTLGADVLAGATWTLQRQDVRIVLDYEPHPARLNFSQLPPVDERLESSIEWAIKRQFVDEQRTIFGSRDECSPDYVLRIEGPGGRVLAVGDASLADPEFHPTARDDKVAKVARYRNSLYWWAGARAHSCHALGSFVLLPGPTVRWSQYRANSREQDVWLLCPRPSAMDDPTSQVFTAFLEHLLDGVLAPRG